MQQTPTSTPVIPYTAVLSKGYTRVWKWSIPPNSTAWLKNTHHSKVIIHWLEGAAEQLAGFWVPDFSNAPTILRVPDAQGPV